MLTRIGSDQQQASIGKGLKPGALSGIAGTSRPGWWAACRTNLDDLTVLAGDPVSVEVFIVVLPQHRNPLAGHQLDLAVPAWAGVNKQLARSIVQNKLVAENARDPTGNQNPGITLELTNKNLSLHRRTPTASARKVRATYPGATLIQRTPTLLKTASGLTIQEEHVNKLKRKSKIP